MTEGFCGRRGGAAKAQQKTKVVKFIVENPNERTSTSSYRGCKKIEFSRNVFRKKGCLKQRKGTGREGATGSQARGKHHLHSCSGVGIHLILLLYCGAAVAEHRHEARAAGVVGLQKGGALGMGSARSPRALYIFAVLLGDFPS